MSTDPACRRAHIAAHTCHGVGNTVRCTSASPPGVSLFSTLTMLGSPADVTTQELRIEQFFPADDATDQWIRRLAA